MNVISKQKQILVEHYIRNEDSMNKIETVYEMVVVQMLASYMGDTNECWPTQETFAKVCRMSVSQVREVLNSLEKKGILKVIRKKKQGDLCRNFYYFEETWLERIEKYSSHCFKGNERKIFKWHENNDKENTNQHNKIPEPPQHSDSSIYNNINNNIINFKSVDNSKSNEKVRGFEDLKITSYNKKEDIQFNGHKLSHIETRSNSYVPGGHPNGEITERLKSILGH